MKQHLNQVLVIMLDFIQYFINTEEVLKSSLTSPWLVHDYRNVPSLATNPLGL